jgi:PKD repeat protein
MVSGPGTVAFADTSALATTVSFSDPGAYVVRLSATDGALTTTDDMAVTVTDGSNQAPVVNAGTDGSVVQPNAANLSGSVSDDGLPASGALTSVWSKLSGPGTVTFIDAAAPITTATFSQVGTYVVRQTATDGELTTTDDATVTVTDPVVPSGIIDVPVRLSADDAEEVASTGAVQLTSSDLELVKDSTEQVVGLRFSNVAIPAGSVITAAWVQFEADELSGAAISLTVSAEATDNAVSFTSTPFNVSSRPRITTSVSWSPPPWTVLQERGVGQRTSSLTHVLHEVIARPGWAAGNAVAIVLTGTGARTAEAFDGTAAPVLHVEFTPPAS